MCRVRILRGFFSTKGQLKGEATQEERQGFGGSKGLLEGPHYPSQIEKGNYSRKGFKPLQCLRPPARRLGIEGPTDFVQGEESREKEGLAIKKSVSWERKTVCSKGAKGGGDPNRKKKEKKEKKKKKALNLYGTGDKCVFTS